MPHAPAIDPDEIVIDAGKSEGPDRRYDFRMPVACVDKIRKRLEEGKQPHEGPALFGVLAEICLEEAIGRFDLSPIWGPQLLPQKDSPQPMPEDDFRCAAMIDHAPKVEWPSFGELEFVRPVLDITEAMIDAELEEQLLDAGSASPSQEPLARGDQATARVQLVLADTDEPLVKPIETTIRVPADGRLAMAGGIAIENLAEAIRGCVVGESRTFESIVPKSLRGAEHAGQPAHCTVEIQSTERITPVSIDELIKRYGSPSEVTLRQQVRLSLEHQFSIEQQQHLTDAVFDALTERITCPVPTRVVAKRVAEQQEQMIKSAVESGLEPAEAKTIADEKKKRVLASVMKEANRSVIGMLLRQKLQVGLSEQDVESRIRAMAGLRGMRPEDVRKEVLDAGQIDMVAKQAFESKIAEEILAESTVRDAPAAEVGLRGA